MKYVILIFITRISVFCQNYILIDKQFKESKDTAYVDTVRMPVYLICSSPSRYMSQIGLTVPKYIIPLSHLNKNFTIGDYLVKYDLNNCIEDSVIFFINFSDYREDNSPYFYSASHIPVLKELSNFMNDTALFLYCRKHNTRMILKGGIIYSIYILLMQFGQELE